MYEIDSFTSHHDCECCGSYSCQDVSISDGNKELHKFEHESHFGGGNWDGNWQSIYAFILKDLGYKAIFKATLLDVQDEVEDDSTYYEYYTDQDLSILNVDVNYKRHHYKSPNGEDNSYDLPSSFSFSVLDEQYIIEVDDYTKFYEQAVKALATIHENHESKSYLDDSYDDY
jgi:hypothetical protein